jgi:hypothetical protein
MGAAVEQEIRVKIKAIVDGLKSVQELEATVKSLQSQGNKKLGLDTDKPAAGAFNFVTVLRKLSPELDTAVTKAEGLEKAVGLSGVALGGAAIGAGLLAGALIGLALHAASAAGGLWDLHQRTGFEVETLSALKTALENSGGEIESFQNGLIVFQKNTEKVNELIATHKDKNDALAKAYKALNIDVSSNEKALRSAFNALSRVIDPTERAALAQRLFGKSAKDVLGVIDETGGDFDAYMKRLRELGVIIGEDAAKQADAFNDSLHLVGLRLSALEQQLGSEFLPALTRGLEGVSVLLSANADDWGRWATLVRLAVEAVKKAATIGLPTNFAPELSAPKLADTIGTTEGEEGVSVEIDPRTGKPINPADYQPILHFNPKNLAGGGGGGGKKHKDKTGELLAEFNKAEGDLNAAQGEGDANDLKDLLDREKKLITQALEDRITSYKDYYAQLANIESDALNIEITKQQTALDKINSDLEAEREKIAADKELTPQEKTLKDMAAVDAATAKALPVFEKLVALARDRAEISQRVAAEERKTTEEYSKQIAALQDELLQFKRTDRVDNEAPSVTAARHAIDERFRVLREQAEANGDKVAQAIIDALTKRLLKKAQFDAVEQQIRDVFQRIKDAEAAIDAEVSTGQLSPDDADRKKIEAARLQRQELEKLHGELKGIAETTKDPEMLEAVNRLGIEIAQVGVAVDKLAQTINADLKQALDDTLFAIIRRKESVKQAITDLANHVLDELARIASDAIIEELFGPTGILGNIFKGQSGVGGILSKIFNPHPITGNPQAPPGRVDVINGTSQSTTGNIISSIANDVRGIRHSTTSGLNGVTQATKGVSTEVHNSIQTSNSKVQEIITFLPNLLPAQPSLLRSILVAAAGAVAGQLGSALANRIGGGNSNDEGSSTGRPTTPPVLKHSGGGLVRGPGTSTSDSIHALLSNGEFVIREAAVRNIGADMLAYINRLGRLPALARFADGGPVGFDVSALTAIQTPTFDANRTSGELHLHMHGTYPVSGGKLTQASQQQVERDAARLAERGVRRSIASKK